jgi:hypothetical protein
MQGLGRLLLAWLVLASPLAACSGLSREQAKQVGQVVGLVAGVAIGVAVGGDVGGDVAVAVGGAVGAALGAFIGGEIAEHLDEADRALAAQASQTALDADPLPAPEPPRQPADSAGIGRSAAPAARPAVAWTSERNDGVHGSSTVVATEPGAVGGICKLVHEIAHVGGQELRQEVRYCRAPGRSGWAREA